MKAEEKRSIVVSISVRPDLAKALDGCAVALNRSWSSIGEEALLAWLEGVRRGVAT